MFDNKLSFTALNLQLKKLTANGDSIFIIKNKDLSFQSQF